MKGIILAGGAGTRLYPLTKVISKQLLPVYDKPMIYYPLCTLMLADIREILIISTKTDINRFEALLGDGSYFGISLAYKVQPFPKGLADAFILGDDFLCGESGALILGDNIFYGNRIEEKLHKAVIDAEENGRATIFGYYVKDPQEFGVVAFDESGYITSIEEKPLCPKSNYAVTGLYFYPNDVCIRAYKVTPSDRDELEITTLNDMYLKEKLLNAQILDTDVVWFDTGTVNSLLEAAKYVELIQKVTGKVICSPEQVALKKQWIDKDTFLQAVNNYGKSCYGKSLQSVENG